MGVTPEEPTNSEDESLGNTLYRLEERTSLPPPARQACQKELVRLMMKFDTLSEAAESTDGGKGPEQRARPCESRFRAAVVSVAEAQ